VAGCAQLDIPQQQTVLASISKQPHPSSRARAVQHMPVVCLQDDNDLSIRFTNSRPSFMKVMLAYFSLCTKHAPNMQLVPFTQCGP
jgi:hypothetical protein